MRRELSRSAKTSGLAGKATARRISERAVGPRPLRLPKAIALSVALVSLAFALCYISPLLRVSQVTVVGAATIAPDKVAQAADVEGQNILAVDRDDVARVVGQIPIVKSVRVTRRLPSEVVIAIEERRPWAIWQAKDAKYVIDDEGMVINTTPPSQGLITIVDAGNQSIRPGIRVEPRTVEMAYRLSQILPKEVGAAPKRFEYSQSLGLTVVSDKGWQARFGDAEDVGYKVAALKAILSAAAERKSKVEIIDLRYKGRPYFR